MHPRDHDLNWYVEVSRAQAPKMPDTSEVESVGKAALTEVNKNLALKTDKDKKTEEGLEVFETLTIRDIVSQKTSAMRSSCPRRLA